MKIVRKFSSLSMIVLFLFVLCVFEVVPVLATDDNPIYYQEEVLEVNHLPGNITHTRVKGYSQVTDPTLIDSNAKEAGYGSSKPLIMNQYYSQQVNIIEIANDSPTKLVPWGVVQNGTWSLAKVTDMAADYEAAHPGWKVVAAVNGDFFDINANGDLPYTPSGTMNVEGDMYKINTGWGMLGFNNSGQGPKIFGKTGNTTERSSLPYLEIIDKDGNVIKEYQINKVNEDAATGEISVHFALFNSSHKIVPIDVTNAYIVESPIDTVAYSKKSFFGKGSVSKFGDASLGQDQFAIKTDIEEVKSYLTEDYVLRVQYKLLDADLANADSVIGYHDNVIINGVPGYDNDGYGSARLPRTLVGVKEDGSIIMIVVDGRQAGHGFYGINQEETGALVDYYGMYNGYQMDGGGSATMVVLKDGQLQVVNSPSDSNGQYARSDSDCILVVMQVPVIEYEIARKFDTLEFNIDVVEEIEKYKNLYIDLNGVKKQVIDGKVSFDELTSNTEYVYEFFALVDGQYESLIYQGVTSTIKILPEVTGIILDIGSSGGVDNYLITLVINDPDGALLYGSFEINGQKFWQNKGRYNYGIIYENICNTDEWQLNLEYNLLSEEGKQKVTIYSDQLTITFKSLAPVLDAQYEVVENVMNDIFIS